jgi:hypothetical protein
VKTYQFSGIIIDCMEKGCLYQRKNIGLNLFHVFICSFGVENIFTASRTMVHSVNDVLLIDELRAVKLVVGALLDSYDVNRQTAFEILTKLSSNVLENLLGYEYLNNFMEIGKSLLLKSLRPGENETGAIIIRSMCCGTSIFNNSTELKTALDLLDQRLKKAKENLFNSAIHSPLFAAFILIGNLLKDDVCLFKEICDDLVDKIKTSISLVLSILSNQSPEGNLPKSFEEIDIALSNCCIQDASTFTRKEKSVFLLNFSWRTVKEACDLFDIIIDKCDLENVSRRYTLLHIGDLLRSLLTSIRHVGAFSAAYPVYSHLCSRLLEFDELYESPASWLKENLNQSLSCSITRRSAGIPYCILAVLTGECKLPIRKLSAANPSHGLLTYTMNFVIEQIESFCPKSIFQSNMDIPQVHFYNILRKIFMDSSLSPFVTPWLTKSLIIAVNGFDSSVWAIRNCSLLLFSSLLIRSFGSKRSRHDDFELKSGIASSCSDGALHNLPLLKEFMEKKLEECGTPPNFIENACVFPILSIIVRLAANSPGASSLDSFIPYVKIHCQYSKNYKTRRIASIILKFLSKNPITDVIDLVNCINENPYNQNLINGCLLQIRDLLTDKTVDFYEPEIEIGKPFSVYHEVRINKCFKEDVFLPILWLGTSHATHEWNKGLFLSILDMAWSNFDLLFKKKLFKFFISNDFEHSRLEYLWYKFIGKIVLRLLLEGVDDIDVQEIHKIFNHDYEVAIYCIDYLVMEHERVLTLKCQYLKILEEIMITFLRRNEMKNYYLLSQCIEFLCILYQHIPVNYSSWDIVTDIIAQNKSISLKGSAIKFFGVLTYKHQGIRKHDNFKKWMSIFKENSSADCPLPLRIAAASSFACLSKDIFCKEFMKFFGDEGVEFLLLRVANQMLNDDEEEVREIMCKAAGKQLGKHLSQWMMTKEIYRYSKELISNNSFFDNQKIISCLTKAVLKMKCDEQENEGINILFKVEKENQFVEEYAVIKLLESFVGDLVEEK